MRQPESPTRPGDPTAQVHPWASPDPSELRLRIETLGTGPDATVVVWVSGEIDMASVPALRDVFELAVERGSHLVVDLAGVRFINSAGVTALSAAAEMARGSGGTFSLRRPSAVSRKVLRILGLEQPIHGGSG